VPEHYIGLISGTSMDGIDAALTRFEDDRLTLVASHVYAYPPELRDLLQSLIVRPETVGLDQLGELDHWVGECFRDATLALLSGSGVDRVAVTAIGSHGQTVRHQPSGEHPFSLQIGNAAIIAEGTGITTVADFRRADLAAGGQGAPLVPPFHDWLMGPKDKHRVVLNIGGVANITVLPAVDAPVIGFDTGPGNTLLDGWIRSQRGSPYDRSGLWAADGKVNTGLLDELLSDEYFDLPPPKSTGFEYFNLEWLQNFDIGEESPVNIQATLSELTAASIARAVREHAPLTQEVYVCGGGAHNDDLLSRLQSQLPEAVVRTTADIGLGPDWVEAAAFAWLAMKAMKKQPGNLPSVTGARHNKVLGAIHYA
jgi:anhydro-N-acetylmuramic acid kinase